MKKIKLETNKPYRLPNPHLSNQLRLKQIYDNSFHYSKDKSPRNSSNKKQSSFNKYAPLTDRKPEPHKVARYQAYLQSQFINNKARPNRRYHKKYDNQDEKLRSSANNTQFVAQSIARRRPSNNESVDMFKIRKTKKNVQIKKTSVSHSKIGEQQSVSVLFQEAKQLYKHGNFQQAVKLFKVCMQNKSQMPEYQYYAAICHLNLHQYEDGYKILQKLAQIAPNFKKSTFLFAAISAKHLQKYDQALKLCTQGLQIFPNYIDLLMYRAKINQEIKFNYEQAHLDYQKILKQDTNNVQILLKNSQCLFKTQSYTNCLSNLAAALYADKGQHKKQILEKRITINLQLNNLKQVKKDLQKIQTLNGGQECSQLLFLKGYILQKQGMKKQSILCFEQSIKANTVSQAVGKSLVEITKSKIQDRDFYNAYYHICRSRYLAVDSSQIEIYLLFTEGVVNLMKRKIKEGDECFEKLLDKFPKLPSFLKNLFYLYRAFAKFCLSDYVQAIKDYEVVNNKEAIDIYAKFNKLLAEGIVKIQNKSYKDAINFFNQADKIMSLTNLNKIQPYLYRAAAHIEQAKDYIESQFQMEQLKSLEQIFSGLKQLDKAYDLNESNSNMLYFRGLIYLYLGKYEQALQDIIKAISKSEENVAKYFFFRGLTHASLGNNKQALNDLSICSNLDEKFHLVYLQKAKINFQNENVTKALEDLMKLKSIMPQEDVKYHQACLNYIHGHYIMANVCCDQISDPEKARTIKILVKIKLGKIKDAKKLMKSSADQKICDIMLGNTEDVDIPSLQLEYFQLFHYHHYLGLRQFKKGNYVQAINTFMMAVKQRNLYDLEQGITNNSLSEGLDSEIEDQGDESEKDVITRINYNIFICYLLEKEYKNAYQIFIRDIISTKKSLLKNQFIASFTHSLFQSISLAEEMPSQKKQIYQLSLFESRLDKLSQSILIQLPSLYIKTRICYLSVFNSKIQKQYATKANQEFIINYITLKQIENRPEPPWVRRQQAGLIFTDQVTNINIQFMTTQNDEQEEDEQQEQDQEDEQDNEENDQDDDNQDDQRNRQKAPDMSVRKFKEHMKLGDSIERKLQKIMQRKKQKQSIEQ